MLLLFACELLFVVVCSWLVLFGVCDAVSLLSLLVVGLSLNVVARCSLLLVVASCRFVLFLVVAWLLLVVVCAVLFGAC